MLVLDNEHPTQHKRLFFRPQKPPFRCKVTPSTLHSLYVTGPRNDGFAVISARRAVEAHFERSFYQWLRLRMRKVDAPIFQILLRHHDDGRAAQGAGWANDSFADGPEHSGFRNVQQTAQFACADERQIVTGTWKADRHNAGVGVSTRTVRRICRFYHRGWLSFRVIQL